jgi:acyl dehydratase
MRLFVDNYLSSVASLASPGVDELRWLKPVRPGDTLRIRVAVTEARRSRSKPDRGIIRIRNVTTNQRGEVVQTFLALVMVKRRPSPD